MKPFYFILILAVIMMFLSSCTSTNEMPGGVADWSNKNAPKTIESKDITLFKTYFIHADRAGGYTRCDFGAEKQTGGTVALTSKSYSDETKIEVDAEFLLSLQEIIDKHSLASFNGTNRVTSGLPYQCEPCHLHCEYASGEIINFYMNGNPDSEWMSDFVALFSTVFPTQSDSVGINHFYYNHIGMAKPDIYGFKIEKVDDNYTLRADFFDSENSHKTVELFWEGAEYRDIIVQIYAEAVGIYESCDISSWDGFNKTNKSARDGSMFDIYIEFENGKSISAFGNNAFPPSFSIAENEFKLLFDKIISFYSEFNEVL